jgi:deoxyribonuclease-4
MFGSHLSIAGSMVNALDEAARLHMDTVQVFTKNQQQWKAPPLDPAAAKSWRDRVAELGWQGRTVSHASYLINLGSPDPELWKKSIDLMVIEIERCHELEIPFLVHHPGAFTTSTREEGLAKIALAYRELFNRTRGAKVISCLENTVGGGSNLGREFEEIARLRDLIIDATASPERLGVCFDTCHAHAGGYDLSTKAAAEAALETFDNTVGLEWIHVLHLNDSKAKLGSRLDRHEHIGKGTIGLAGFGVVVNRPEFASIPKILETPKEDPKEMKARKGGVHLDTVNLRRLWRLRGSGPIKQPKLGSKRQKRGTPR